MALKPFEWKDKPALIEHLFPVQKISAESYKEQMADQVKLLPLWVVTGKEGNHLS